MILHRYVDGSGPRFANISLASGERLFLSLGKSGFAIFRLHLWGRVPGRRLFAANLTEMARMARVLAREPYLPPLPRATQQHRDEGAMDSLLDAALSDISALDPGAVDRLDLAAPRPLALFTRLALTCVDANECVRRFERVRSVPG